MALAILLGGIFGLVVAGAVLAIGTARKARRDQDDINVAFAKARGEEQHSEVGPAPWSAFDFEALVDDGVVVDRSDPYATLTNSQISWSESTLEDGHAPLANVATEAEEALVAEVDETFAAEPDETFVGVATEADETFAAEADETFVEVGTEADQTFAAEADETFVAEPAPMLPEAVSSGAAPQRIDDERPVIWRAPAESQVIILVVALRALADGVAATLTPEGARQWNGLENAMAHARDIAYEHEKGNGRSSSIDVDGRDRPTTANGSVSRVGGDDRSRSRSVPRRSGPSRRHTGPKPIAWRARPY
jgi:hypothetical protein